MELGHLVGQPDRRFKIIIGGWVLYLDRNSTIIHFWAYLKKLDLSWHFSIPNLIDGHRLDRGAIIVLEM